MAGKDPQYVSKLVLKNGGAMETEEGDEIIAVDSSGSASIKAELSEDLPQGNIYVGDATGTTSELDASGDAQLLIGDGSTINSVSVTGDLSIDNAGNATVNIQRPVEQWDGTLNATEIKALATSPYSLLGAPGPDTVYQFIGATLTLVAGSEVLAEAGDNLAFRYTDGSGVIVSEAIETTGFIDQAADTITNAIPVKDAIVAFTGAENQDLVLDNTGNDFTGNVSDDAELQVSVLYSRIFV